MRSFPYSSARRILDITREKMIVHPDGSFVVGVVDGIGFGVRVVEGTRGVVRKGLQFSFYSLAGGRIAIQIEGGAADVGVTMRGSGWGRMRVERVDKIPVTRSQLGVPRRTWSKGD